MKTKSKQHKIFISTGEPSGDRHGAYLIKTLMDMHPSLKITGIAGPLMRATSAIKCILPMESLQVMGFSDVLKKLPSLWKSFREVLKYILKENPHMVIFVDYPDFNLRLAKALREKGFTGKLVHYICPTVWAWRDKRIDQMTATLDLLLVIYPFEPEYFARTTLKTKYIGNPLASEIARYKDDKNWKKTYNLTKVAKKNLIGIFPGSRPQEIEYNLERLLKASIQLQKSNPLLHFAISAANENIQRKIEKIVRNLPPQEQVHFIIVPFFHTYELMKSCHIAMATSGTITLELALHETPTIVVYKLSLLNYLLAKYLFHIDLPHYCIVNIIAGHSIFPELIHTTFNEENLFKAVQELEDPARHKACIENCQKLKAIIGSHNSYKILAQEITLLLQKK